MPGGLIVSSTFQAASALLTCLKIRADNEPTLFSVAFSDTNNNTTERGAAIAHRLSIGSPMRRLLELVVGLVVAGLCSPHTLAQQGPDRQFVAPPEPRPSI